MSMYHAALFFPDIEIAMSAQTKENAASLLKAKHHEILRFYPLLKNEVLKDSFSKMDARVEFTSGAIIDTLVNNPNSKGQRRKRLNIEESALLNNYLYQEVLEPIPNVPRRTIGKLAVINPEELNGQINFFSTSGFRGSDEFQRNLTMLDDMANLKGKIVIGASWELACEYGRGETKSKILLKKANNSPIHFAQNYESKWVGNTESAVVDIRKLLDTRSLSKPEYIGDKISDYIVSMDIARSNRSGGNQSSIVVLKIIRNKDGYIKNIEVPYLYNVPSGLNFEEQTIELKRLCKRYNPKTVVIDGNVIGKGVLEECLKEQTDPLTGKTLECWDTINTDDKPKIEGARKVVFVVEAQGINSEIIFSFIEMVENKKLRLLEKRIDADYDITDKEYIEQNIYPFLQTDALIEEVSNLKMKELSKGRFTVESILSSIDKDRYSACAYGLYYIKYYINSIEDSSEYDFVFEDYSF